MSETIEVSPFGHVEVSLRAIAMSLGQDRSKAFYLIGAVLAELAHKWKKGTDITNLVDWFTDGLGEGDYGKVQKILCHLCEFAFYLPADRCYEVLKKLEMDLEKEREGSP